jgi:hypothetical protein
VQRLVPCHRSRRPAGPELPQVTGEPGEQLVDAGGAQLERGELDRQRHAVELTAQVHEPGQRARRDLELGQHREPVGEQADRLAGTVGGAERRDTEDHLARQVERLTAGHQQHRLGVAVHDRVGERGTGVDHVLTGIKDEQRPPAEEPAREPAGRRLSFRACLPPAPEGGCHRARDSRRVARRRQVGEEHPAGKRSPRLARHPDGEPCLADAARTRQGDQPGPGQRVLNGGSLFRPPDEPRSRFRQSPPMRYQAVRPSPPGKH